MPTARTNLLDLDRKAMEAFFQALGHKAFHGRNVLKWIHKHGVTDFEAMTNLPKALRATLRDVAEVVVPEVVLEQPAADGTRKWLLELADGQRIESVLIPDGDRTTLCVSSQVGCALDCSFCSTARQGFNRNLGVGEIVAQVWVAWRRSARPLTNVVLMGMGEPLANFEAVVSAMDVMQDDLAYGLSKYRVTLSTSGIVPAIRRLREVSDVSLAVSLHGRFRKKSSEPSPRRKPGSRTASFIIGVGRADWLRSPLPPNRTGGSPASGPPVGGFTSKRIDEACSENR